MVAQIASMIFGLTPAALPFPDLQGTITVQDFAGDVTGLPFVIEVRNVGSTIPLQTAPVTLGPTGNYLFTLTVTLPGTYDVAAKAPNRWMRQVLSSMVISASGGTANFNVVNGDVDGDNIVDMLDYSYISYGYGSCVGDAMFMPIIDLNGDECIDIADYAILSSQLFTQGDP